MTPQTRSGKRGPMRSMILILAQRTTNASVGHFNQLFFGTRQVGTATFYQLCVDIDL
jgi:hypothetical protein